MTEKKYKSKDQKYTIHVQNMSVGLLSRGGEGFVSLTDIAKYKNADDPRFVVQNWMKTRATVEFLGLWEVVNNPHFNRVEFEAFKNDAGSNAFTMTPKKWIESTIATGILSKSGRYGGGTYAHSDIAFEFASWVSTEFKLYLIKEFQRLKVDESQRLSVEWNVHRTLAKVSYRIHTDVVKKNLIPPTLSAKQMAMTYATEADVLNAALFGQTAAQWCEKYSHKKGNMRDFAGLEQLLILANMESMNAELIHMGVPQKERLIKLNKMAIRQMRSITQSNTI